MHTNYSGKLINVILPYPYSPHAHHGIKNAVHYKNENIRLQKKGREIIAKLVAIACRAYQTNCIELVRSTYYLEGTRVRVPRRRLLEYEKARNEVDAL